MVIDPASAIPLHAQLEEALLTPIRVGDMQSGSQLPPEDELIARYKVSRTTVRTAIQSLVRRGLVDIRRGKGTFVTEPVVVEELTSLTGFVEDPRAANQAPSARLLDRRPVAASETVARQLAVERGTMVARIQRVRLRADLPLSFHETYLPQELGEKILTNDLDRQTIFALLERKYSTPLLEAEYRLATVASHGTVARAMGIDAGGPIFLIERTTYSERRRPVSYERLYYRGDHIRFETRLTHGQSVAARRAGVSRREPSAI